MTMAKQVKQNHHFNTALCYPACLPAKPTHRILIELVLLLLLLFLCVVCNVGLGGMEEKDENDNGAGGRCFLFLFVSACCTFHFRIANS